MSKKTFIKPLILAFVAILIIISSCTVQERRYSKGYYVNLSKNKNSAKSKQLKKDEAKKNYLTVKENKIEHTVSKSNETTPVDLNQGNLIASDNKDILVLSNGGDVEQKNNSSKIENKLSKDKQNLKKLTKDEAPKKTPNNDKSKRKLAIIIGLSVLLLGTIAFLTTPILSELFVVGDSALTALNVTSNFAKYIKHVIGWIGILLCDIMAALGINKYYKKEKPKLAKLTSVLRFIYSFILGIGIFQLLRVTQTSPASAIYNSINMFNKFWGIGLIVFGVHLIALGILFNNEGGKKWVNIAIKSLLIIAGIGYIIINVGALLVPNPLSFVAMLQPIFIIPMILGEVFYAIWKIVKGGKKSK